MAALGRLLDNDIRTILKRQHPLNSPAMQRVPPIRWSAPENLAYKCRERLSPTPPGVAPLSALRAVLAS